MPLLIDCDPGIDDMVALLLACASPEVDLVGVTTVAGNVEGATVLRNALDVLALAGRPDIPVAAGADRPLVADRSRQLRTAHGDGGLGAARLEPSPAGAVDGHAVPFLAAAITRSAEPVTLVATGPLTNIALLYALYPEAAASLRRLVVMGGAVGPGNITPAAEFNVWSDPEAAHRVLSAPGLPRAVPTTLVGLDVTLKTLITVEDAEQLRVEGGRAGEAVAEGLAGYDWGAGGDGNPVHDAVAVAEAIRPGILVTRPCRIEVDYGPGPGRGNTLTDFRAPDPGVSVAVGGDFPGIVRFIVQRLTRRP